MEDFKQEIYTTYLPVERREFILARIKERGAVRTFILAREMKVTDETVRNDLKFLEKKNLLSRVHGGAISLEKKAFEDSLDTPS